MALPAWPEELDPPMRAGYTILRTEARRRSKVEQGPHRQGRRLSAVSVPVAMTLDVSRDERARFDRFYDEEVSEGSLPFLIKDPTTHDLPILIGGVQLLDHLDRIITIAAWQLARFGESLPEVTVIGIRYRIRFSIEVMP